ncbi:sugar kinase [Brachybacterium endophyticum]|uniref:Sugar kinase n=1 Tax=Brachybacterium endophyticum TaxID=2182385 RepID=A0A2U2RJD5_9MICO|nr:FGGY family carbohydrate kinase [Brachybacterium endophyticum]PWH05989.1 sugar kinase [Brachybacterium endophyticum]
MTPRFATPSDDAVGPFVVGLDVGSGGSRAAVYDASGREVGTRHHKVEHQFTTSADGTSTIDADQVVEELCTAMEAVLEGNLPGPVVGIGVDTFASSLIAVDDSGAAITPCITYADTRCRDQVTALRDELDPTALHDLTGARLHSSYNTPRLRWLREQHPDVFSRAKHFMALGEYVALKLLGTGALGTASAAWGGMIDRRTGEYVPELVEAAGVDPDTLAAPLDPSQGIPVEGTKLAQRIPVLAGATWIPVVGDGLTANIGIGAVGPGTWGISTATSGAIRQLLDTDTGRLPEGLWAYRVDAARTLVGSAMSDCGRVLDFARTRFAIPEDVSTIDTTSLLSAAPDGGVPLVVPFLSGERGTMWRDSARAVFANVSSSTTAEDLLRGSLEGLALSYLRIADQLRTIGGEPQRIVLSGGMTENVPAWLHLLADALQIPIDHVAISRSTMRGAALLALEQTAPDVERATIPVLNTVDPVAEHADYYRERLRRFEVLADVA